MDRRKIGRLLYHGTRADETTVRAEGLRWPTEEEFLGWIRRCLEVVGLRYETWLDRQQGRIHHRVTPPNTLYEMRGEWRRMVWATEQYETAASYAIRAPELVWLAVNVEWIWTHREKKGLDREAGERATRAVEGVFGSPKVVILDGSRFPRANGINAPLGLSVPPEAILEVRMVT